MADPGCPDRGWTGWTPSEAQSDRDRNELERLGRGLDAGVARLDEQRRALQAESHADPAVPAEARGRSRGDHGVTVAVIAISPPRVAYVAVTVLGEMHLRVVSADPGDHVTVSGAREQV